MSLDLRTLVGFFAEFELRMEQDAPPGLMTSFPRNTSNLNGLGRIYSSYSNCAIEIYEENFTEGLEDRINLKQIQNESITQYIQPAEIGSLVLNFDTRAEVFINAAINGNGKPILNECYRRFLFIKELMHIVLRDEFIRHKISHPDTDNPELLVTLLEELIYLPFSIVDFDSPDYNDTIKVEHAAELFAALSLYPLDRVDADRTQFMADLGVASMEHPLARTSSTLVFAESHKIPRRYVDLLFRWKRFDEFYDTYRQAKRGY